MIKSFERIHRSNLIGMGIPPLQFLEGDTAASLGLDGSERYHIPAPAAGQDRLEIGVQRSDGTTLGFPACVRIDTPNEFADHRNGGFLHHALRRLAGS